MRKLWHLQKKKKKNLTLREDNTVKERNSREFSSFSEKLILAVDSFSVLDKGGKKNARRKKNTCFFFNQPRQPFENLKIFTKRPNY